MKPGMKFGVISLGVVLALILLVFFTTEDVRERARGPL